MNKNCDNPMCENSHGQKLVTSKQPDYLGDDKITEWQVRVPDSKMLMHTLTFCETCAEPMRVLIKFTKTIGAA